MLIYYLPLIIILWSTPGYTTPSSSFKVHNDGQIDQTQLLVSDISNLYISKKFSDVYLYVGKERLEAHRVVLASRSEYFSTLFYGELKIPEGKDVNITEVSIKLFEIILEYIYTGRIYLGDLEGIEVFELLKLSDFYGITHLKHLLHEYLQKSIKEHDVCSFLSLTRFYQYTELEMKSLNYIDINALNVLKSEDFLTLSTGTLQEILNRDTFYANEVVIFHAVCRWINKNQIELDHNTKIKVLSDVRYSLMSDEEQSEARKSQLVSSDLISDAIQLRKTLTSDKPQFRGQLIPNVNHRYQSHSPPVTNKNLIHMSQGFSASNDFGTNMIKLNDPSTINFIEITLWDKHGVLSGIDYLQCYSYYIEVSIDGKNWARVIDHSSYNCRSHQYLWIHPQIVRYIHIVGTNSTANETFKIRKVKYNTIDMHNFENINGLVVPKENVATQNKDAVVIEGKNSFKTFSMLNNYYDDDARHEMYTYHLLESGCIVIHLTQPYIISSMRLLLWGGINQFYRYTIESSVNNHVWEMLVDKSKKPSQSWQLLQFKPTPMLYIRITGFFCSTGNEDFRCIYFEAPAKVPLDSNVDEDVRAKNNETDVTMT